MNAQTETNLLLVAAEPLQTFAEQLADHLAKIATLSGLCAEIEMLAEQRHEPDIAILAAVCRSVLGDAHQSGLDHLKGLDIDLDEALGLVDRAENAALSILAAIGVLAQWASELLGDHPIAQAA